MILPRRAAYFTYHNIVRPSRPPVSISDPSGEKATAGNGDGVNYYIIEKPKAFNTPRETANLPPANQSNYRCLSRVIGIAELTDVIQRSHIGIQPIGDSKNRRPTLYDASKFLRE
jgi:hypothetical protein